MKRNNQVGILIKVDGSLDLVTPKNNTDYKLDELQKLVGGIIDIVYYPNEKDYIMCVNDNGLYEKEHNMIASLFLTMKYKQQCTIHGDVLICHTDMIK